MPASGTIVLILSMKKQFLFTWWLNDPHAIWPRSSQWMETSRIDVLVQENRNSSALAMELRLSCISLSKWSLNFPHNWPLWPEDFPHEGPVMRNKTILIEKKNENVVCKLVAILSRPQHINLAPCAHIDSGFLYTFVLWTQLRHN